jgi:glycine cleavage system H protein
MEFARFKHARFSARLPVDFRYSLSHYWMAPVENETGLWRVGFTKFATRMLGELVEAEWEKNSSEAVESGQQIGWVEGFKAASDVFCVMDGEFAGGNPILDEDACIVRSSPYVDGWLYAVKGQPEQTAVDVNGYIEHLDAIITKMQEDPKYADS